MHIKQFIIKTIPSVYAAISKTKCTTIDTTVLFLYLKTLKGDHHFLL